MSDKEKRDAAKCYLLQIRAAAERLEHIDAHLEKERAAIFAPERARVDGVPGHNRRPGGAQSDRLARFMDKTAKRDALAGDYEAMRSGELVRILALDLANPIEYRLMYDVYFAFMRFDLAAKRAGLNYICAQRFHTAALIAFYNANNARVDRFINGTIKTR